MLRLFFQQIWSSTEQQQKIKNDTDLFSIDCFDPLVLDAELVETRVHLCPPVRTSLQVDHVDVVHPEVVLRRWTKDIVRQLWSDREGIFVGHDLKFEIRKIQEVFFQAAIKTLYLVSL